MSHPHRFSILEIMVALVILTVVIFGLISLIFNTMIMHREAQENMLVNMFLRTKLEEIQSTEWENIYALFHAKSFPAQGLKPIDPESNVLFIQFYVNEEGINDGNPVMPVELTPALRQNLGFPNPPTSGQGVDLNGDGIISSESVSLSYILLPTRIQARWKSLSGERIVNLYTILGKSKTSN